MKKLLIIIASFIILSCVPKINNFDEYKKQPILKVSSFKKEDALNPKPSIVVLNFDNKAQETAKKAKLGRSLAVQVENVLTSSKLAKIEDRKAFKKLAKEILLIELEGQKEYKGPVSADYAVSGDIESSGYNHKFIAGKNICNKNGCAYIPPKNIYIGSVSGNLKIYKLPSLEVVESIPFKGIKRRSENATSSGFLFTRKSNTQITKSDNNLVRQAGANAIKSQAHNLKNIFSDLRKAYIIDKKTYKKKTIFQINLGSKDNIKAGQKVKIIGKKEVKNPLTNEIVLEETILTQAVITNLITKQFSWIIIKDKKIIAKIRQGHSIKVIYKKDRKHQFGKVINMIAHNPIL